MKGSTGIVLATFLGLVPTTAAAQPHLIIQTDGDCPSAAAVREALYAIRPDDEWPSLVATVHEVEGRVQVALGQDPSNQREIPVTADCTERASSVALVVAVWSSELPAQPTGAPRLAVAIPTPMPAPLAASRQSNIVTEVGAIANYGLVGGFAPGAAFELGFFRRQAWWGWRAGLAYQSSRSMRVSIGASNYERGLLSGALVLRRDWRRMFLSSDLEFVAAYTRAHGEGYSQDQSAGAFNLAPSANGRLGVRWGSMRFWAQASGRRWLAKETFRIDPISAGSATTAVLPAWDAHVGLGAGITFD